jgi:predicted glutamine amidotransferase
MCIIIAKNKKSGRVPTIEEVRNSFEYNGDGAGFMYVDNGKVIIDKGYMTLNKFLDRYNELLETYDNFRDKSLVIHCRIGTSSGNTPQNTHPYRVSGREKDLHRLNDSCELGVVHNGIISQYTPKSIKSSTNDTQEFIMRYLFPLYSNWKDFYKSKAIRDGIADITNSKLVFLDANDDLYYVGDFIKDEGIMFSNSTYKTYNYNWSKYSYYDNYYEDHFYDKCDYDKYADDEYLVMLESDNYVEYDGSYAQVGDKELLYDVYSGSLYRLDSNNTCIFIATNVRVYDKDYEEIY